MILGVISSFGWPELQIVIWDSLNEHFEISPYLSRVPDAASAVLSAKVASVLLNDLD